MAALRRLFSRAKNKVTKDQENGSRRAVMEELFYDFNRSRAQVYKMNFIRGILFGAGSVIGGTLIIALLVWMLSLLSHVVPPLGDFFTNVSETLQSEER